MDPKPYTLLIVDDNSSNIELLFHSLNTQYNILVAKNGKTAIKLAQEKLPDLILLDIAMPGLDGFEVIENLKSDSRTTIIPVIFVTGKSNYEHRTKGYHLGAVDYITKPFELNEVKTRIQAQLQLNTNARNIMLMNDVMGKLSVLYWQYDHQRGAICTCGSVEGCIGISVEDNNIFSEEFQGLLSPSDREKRAKVIDGFSQKPAEYSLRYEVTEPGNPILLEKGFVSKTEPHISYGFIINISKEIK